MRQTSTIPEIADFPTRPMREPAWTVPRVRTRPISKPAPVVPKARVTRRFECEWLENGNVLSHISVAPALPAFEAAFNAFTHGALIHTADGPIAVEDLEPGMELECADGRYTQLVWKGAITLVPGAPTLGDEPKLYRVMPDAFGLGRPVQDQSFGPGARRLDRNPKLRTALGTEAALVPLPAMVDGHSVIEVTPVSPTRVYHLACANHEMIMAAGLEVETFHPGPETPLSLPEEMMQLFMRFFPHLRDVREFGRLNTARITQEDLLTLVS